MKLEAEAEVEVEEEEEEEVESRSVELAGTAAVDLRSRSREEEELRRKRRIRSKVVLQRWEEGKRDSTTKGSLGREFRRRFDRSLRSGGRIEDEQDRHGCTEGREEEVGSKRKTRLRWE